MADSTNVGLREEKDANNSVRCRKTQNSHQDPSTEAQDVGVSADRTPSYVQPSGSLNGPTHSRSGSASRAVECSTREYAQAFRQWLWQYQWWMQMSMMYHSFPMYQMNYMPLTPQLMNQQSTGMLAGFEAANSSVTAATGQAAAPGPLAQPPLVNGIGLQPVRGRECRLPALWKRVVAEFIDFFLLFVVKLAASIMVVEYFGLLSDMDKYDIDQLLAQDWDTIAAMSFTSDLIIMELLNRIMICFFETLCLHRGAVGRVGGTTPGKFTMRLRVISCQAVAQLEGNRILVVPGNNIGFWNALLRSIIKNFSMVFFFPVCLTVFFFPHSRTAYDIASSSIVVEVTPEDDWAWPRR